MEIVYTKIVGENDGTVWATGFNGEGELGDGTTTNKTIPLEFDTSFFTIL